MTSDHPAEPAAAGPVAISSAATSSLPEYSADALRELSTRALLDLIIADEDRIPRNVIDECARRGEPMVTVLTEKLEDHASWDEPIALGAWWLNLHAVHILGLMASEGAARALVDAMVRMDREADDDLQEWVSGYWPALFQRAPASILPVLEELAARDESPFVRVTAWELLVAAAERQGAAMLDERLDRVALVVEDEREPLLLRDMLANVLLDFPRERHRALLERLASMPREYPDFTVEDVQMRYAEGYDDPEWLRFADPWEFYAPENIRARQQRWAEEEMADPEDMGLSDDADYQPFSLPYVREAPKIGRNDPCPCGSGRKYKKCCLPGVP